MQCCGSGMFYPGSRIRIPKFFNTDPGSQKFSSRILPVLFIKRGMRNKSNFSLAHYGFMSKSDYKNKILKKNILTVFFTRAVTHHLLRFCFYMIHSQLPWPRSGDCGGSRIRTRDSCVLCLVSPSCLSQLSHHIPTLSHHIPTKKSNQNLWIPDLGSGKFIPDPGGKKAPDPESVSATLNESIATGLLLYFYRPEPKNNI
jgi:hypothetical protein